MADLGDREQFRQRARKPRVRSEDESSKIASDIAEAYDLVPELGNGYRWYDWPYRALRWVGTGWRRDLLPRRIRTAVWKGVNWFYPFNEHDRNKAWTRKSWMHNVSVPAKEHVNLAGIWLVELFPPTQLPALERSLRRNGWNRRPLSSPLDGDNQQQLARARAAAGPIWWRMVDVLDWDSQWLVADGVRERMPAEFSLVELRAVQVGASLTAVIAEFHLRPGVDTALDFEWHKVPEPLLLRGRPRWRAMDRQWATYWRVQSRRKELHYAARDWLASKLPGFFAQNGEPPPLLDLMLFDQHDPTIVGRTASRKSEVRKSDAYRALGIPLNDYYQATSPALPKLVLSRLDGRMHEALGDDPTWTLWGKRDAVVKALGPDGLGGYGSDPNRAIASRLVDNMNNLFVMLAVSEFLSVTDARYAELRDRAGVSHGKFRPSALRALRKSFLTLSLDLSSVRPDVEAFWNRNWRWDGDAQFTYHVAPYYRSADRKAGRKVEEPIDYNENLRESQQKDFARLGAADRNYRDILSTVASLGASADSYKLGRIALWVAVVSLVVAVATVLVSELSATSVLGWIWTEAGEWFGWN